MLFKLALGNVRKSARDYAIYFVTLSLGVAVFYAFNSIADQASFLSESTSELLQTLSDGISGITVFLALVLGFLMVYANNYLVRRRKRELGLYQVLGMTRGQVSGVLTLETLIASVGSLVVGFLAGVLLSQLLVFLTAALFNDAVRNFSFKLSAHAFVLTLVCFAIIFVVMLLFNLRSLRKVNLSELMGAERANEQVKVRGLPATIVLGVAGLGLMGVAYWRLSKDGLPISGSDEYREFLITTIMVSAGTIAFFYALSGIILRLGQANRTHYYRGINMFTLRQLASRVNTVSISMGVVSLILFLAITISASGFGIQAVYRTNLEAAAPYDATVSTLYSGLIGVQDVRALLEEQGMDVSSFVSESCQVDVYDSAEIPGGESLGLSALSEASGVELPEFIRSMDESGNPQRLNVMSEGDFNEMMRAQGRDEVSLGNGGYLFLCNQGADYASFLGSVASRGTKVGVAGVELSPVMADVLDDSRASYANSPIAMNSGTIVVPDSVVESFGVSPIESNLILTYSMDEEAGDAAFRDLFEDASGRLLAEDGENGALILYEAYTRTDVAVASVGLGGAVAYLAIYIGFVLVVACAAILAIQQLSAASDAAPSYRLLSEIGVPRKMAMSSLCAQIAWSFALPMVVALAHSACAMNQIFVVLRQLGRASVVGYSVAAVAVFVGIYLLYFVITYQTARGVVSSRTRLARE